MSGKSNVNKDMATHETDIQNPVPIMYDFSFLT